MTSVALFLLLIAHTCFGESDGNGLVTGGHLWSLFGTRVELPFGKLPHDLLDFLFFLHNSDHSLGGIFDLAIKAVFSEERLVGDSLAKPFNRQGSVAHGT